ncbi:MAG: type II toxin-antitoxin system RelE/ParE family toxin [Vicingaceae bacterium]|nr:type II toxin-antitoxin system RelE/ParE family toxin [Vicingaceae bacterium]
MSFIVVVEKRALKDAQKAIDYYDEQRIGLGEKFNAALDKHILAIANNPFYQLRYKDYRALPIKKFPYLILFYIQEDANTVFVTAIFHTKQNTNKLPK